jgi:hypothetical protein
LESLHFLGFPGSAHSLLKQFQRWLLEVELKNEFLGYEDIFRRFCGYANSRLESPRRNQQAPVTPKRPEFACIPAYFFSFILLESFNSK